MASADSLLSTYADSIRGFSEQNKFSEKIIAILRRDDYHFQKVLGRGSYGNIYQARKNGEDRSWALKIVPRDKVSETELTAWEGLEHANLLKLEELIDVTSVGGYVFVTAVLPQSLNQVISSTKFAKSSAALAMIKTWTREILQGLEYLQAKKLAHLDLKTSNVLIGLENDAVICDFGFLTSADVPTRKYGIFLPYGPPERFKVGMWGHDAALDGFAADVWCVGVLVLNCLSRQTMAWKLDKFATNWTSDLYPDLFEMLEPKNLAGMVKRKLSECPFDEEEMSKIRNFVTQCLRLDSKSRPTAADALKHRWFCEDSEEFQPDRLWQTKVPPEEMSLMIFGYQQEILNRIKESRRNHAQFLTMRYQVRFIISTSKEVVEKNLSMLKNIPRKLTYRKNDH